MRKGRAQPLDGGVRRPPLGDAAQAEPQTSRQPDAPPARLQLDVAPGSRRERASRLAGRRLAPRDQVEVPVVAQGLQLRQQGGIEESAAGVRALYRRLDRLEQQRRCHKPPAGRTIEGAQLALGAEPRQARVHLAQEGQHGVGAGLRRLRLLWRHGKLHAHLGCHAPLRATHDDARLVRWLLLHLLLRPHCSVVHRYETPVVVVGTLNVGVVVMLLVSVPPLGVSCGVAAVVPALVWWAACLAGCARWTAPAYSAMAAAAPPTRSASVSAVRDPLRTRRPSAPRGSAVASVTSPTGCATQAST